MSCIKISRRPRSDRGWYFGFLWPKRPYLIGLWGKWQWESKNEKKKKRIGLIKETFSKSIKGAITETNSWRDTADCFSFVFLPSIVFLLSDSPLSVCFGFRDKQREWNGEAWSGSAFLKASYLKKKTCAKHFYCFSFQTQKHRKWKRYQINRFLNIPF